MNDYDSRDVNCQQCGLLIGSIVTVEDLEYLKVGNMIINVIHGCCKCGQPFHFTTADSRLTRLLKKARREINQP